MYGACSCDLVALVEPAVQQQQQLQILADYVDSADDRQMLVLHKPASNRRRHPV